MKHIMGIGSASKLSNVEEKDIQPNAVDLRIGSVFKISDAEFVIDEQKKVHRGSSKMETDDQEYYNLQPGHYEVIMANEIVVGDNEAGWVITRSMLSVASGCCLGAA